MRRTLVSAAALGLALSLGSALAEAPSEQTLIDWRLVPLESQDQDGDVRLILRQISGTRSWSSHSRNISADRLLGFDLARLASPDRTLASFTLSGDPGQLSCDGSVQSGTGSGECDFTPDHGFGEQLAAMGLERPRDKDLYQLLLADVTLDSVREIEGWGYGQPDLDDLLSFAIHGVDNDFVSALSAVGLRPDALDDLVAFRIHGVDADFVEGFGDLGPAFEGLHGDDYVNFRIHGVTPGFVRELQTLGLGEIGPDEARSFRIHGVTPDFVGAVRAMGPQFETMDGGDFIRFAIHGVAVDQIEAFADLGYSGLGPSTLVDFRIHGVTPAYAGAFTEKGLPQPAADRLVQLKISGFDPDRIE